LEKRKKSRPSVKDAKETLGSAVKKYVGGGEKKGLEDAVDNVIVHLGREMARTTIRSYLKDEKVEEDGKLKEAHGVLKDRMLAKLRNKTAMGNRIDKIAMKVAGEREEFQGWVKEGAFKEELDYLQRLGRQVVMGIRRRYAKAKLEIKGYYSQYPLPGATVEINSSIGRVILLNSQHKTYRPYQYSGERKLDILYTWYIQAYTGHSENVEPPLKPTARDVMKFFDILEKNVGVEKVQTALGIDIWEKADVSKPTLAEVREFIKSRFRMEPDGDEKDRLSYSVRDDGNVGEETPGVEDMRMMNTIKRELLGKYGSNNVRVRVETVDEWVDLEISLK
jgi:hypothetical protein